MRTNRDEYYDNNAEMTALSDDLHIRSTQLRRANDQVNMLKAENKALLEKIGESKTSLIAANNSLRDRITKLAIRHSRAVDVLTPPPGALIRYPNQEVEKAFKILTGQE